MNTFNRFLLIILALGSALFWMAAVLSIWVFPRELAEVFRSFSTMLRLQPSVLQGLITALGVSAGAVSLLVLVGELFPQEPTMVTVDNVHGGTAAVTVAALMLGLKQQLEERTGLQAVRPTVTSHHNGLDVHVEMHADQDTQLVHSAESITQAVRTQVEGQWGLKLHNVRVTFTQPIYQDRQPPSSGNSQSKESGGNIIVPSQDNDPGRMSSIPRTFQRPSEMAQEQSTEQEKEERDRSS